MQQALTSRTSGFSASNTSASNTGGPGALPGRLFMMLACILCLGLTACATPQLAERGFDQPRELQDPFEGFNRAVFSFNEGLDKILLRPVAQAYKFVLPQFVRDGVRNILRNLSGPIVMANQLLQGDIDGFLDATGRLMVNSTVGIAGFFDVGAKIGMPYEDEDFGQTLATWGWDPGPYVVLPVLGPTTWRDGIGRVPDSFADPLSHYATNTEREWILAVRAGVNAVDARSRVLGQVQELREDSVDYYATIRSIWWQSRLRAIRDGQTSDSWDDPWADESRAGP